MDEPRDPARAHSLPPDSTDIRPPIRTLVVDDDAAINEVFSSVLRAEGYEVCSVASAREALDLICRRSFDILLTDVMMPEMNGLELLQQVHARIPDLPVILITGYPEADLVRRALDAGASDFVSKPCNQQELRVIVERNLARQSLAQRRRRSHENELQVSYESVLDALLSALDTRDTETQGHSERVTAYTIQIAHRLGVSSDEQYHIERGALLHDIGKIGVPDRILLNPGPLTPEEWVEMHRHPSIGFRMCARIEFLKGAAQIVLHHHERWDGTGYPDGLSGEQIPLGARIFAVADAFDAMTSDRPYRKAVSDQDAREEIVAHSGTQFDPRVVEAFRSIPPSRWQQLRDLFEK